MIDLTEDIDQDTHEAKGEDVLIIDSPLVKPPRKKKSNKGKSFHEWCGLL